MSRFYIGDSSPSRSVSSASDDDTLPYPEALERNDFLTPDFKPSQYLSSLHNRHQTLEDLRSELRSRSQQLSKELLDLVNSNYQDFLGLGRSLKSGDERVEEVRVGLLGFRKEVENVKARVVEREIEVEGLVDERVEIRKKIAVGRKLVDYEARLALLEEQLMVESSGKAEVEHLSESEEDSEEEDEDESEGRSYSMSVGKLRKNVMQYRLIGQIGKTAGEQHPFITAQATRMVKVKNTLLLDLSTALKQAKAVGAPGAGRVVKIMKIYADMDESAEAVKVLKSFKST